MEVLYYEALFPNKLCDVENSRLRADNLHTLTICCYQEDCLGRIVTM